MSLLTRFRSSSKRSLNTSTSASGLSNSSTLASVYRPAIVPEGGNSYTTDSLPSVEAAALELVGRLPLADSGVRILRRALPARASAGAPLVAGSDAPATTVEAALAEVGLLDAEVGTGAAAAEVGLLATGAAWGAATTGAGSATGAGATTTGAGAGAGVGAGAGAATIGAGVAATAAGAGAAGSGIAASVELVVDGIKIPFSLLLDLPFFSFELRRDDVEAGEDSTIGGTAAAAATGATASTGAATAWRGAERGLSSTSFGTRLTSMTEEDEKRESVNSPLLLVALTFAWEAARACCCCCCCSWNC
mmetsp:Transcript_28455/g.48826  ORF Transcript_28455/g.48826 Transcript_28455/m.48826 type:complete len:306 (-) Transcript_28455:1675-2592(-)